MKRSLLLTGLLLISLVLTVQYAASENTATPCSGCQRAGQQAQQEKLIPREQEKLDTFLAETVDLRNELAAKQTAFETYMNSENPDPAKAAMLTSEYYQLRDFLNQKAVQAGIIQQKGGCNGCRGKAGVACNRSPGQKAVKQTN